MDLSGGLVKDGEASNSNVSESHIFAIFVGLISSITGGINFCLIKAGARASDQPVWDILLSWSEIILCSWFLQLRCHYFCPWLYSPAIFQGHSIRIWLTGQPCCCNMCILLWGKFRMFNTWCLLFGKSEILLGDSYLWSNKRGISFVWVDIFPHSHRTRKMENT